MLNRLIFATSIAGTTGLITGLAFKLDKVEWQATVGIINCGVVSGIGAITIAEGTTLLRTSLIVPGSILILFPLSLLGAYWGNSIKNNFISDL